MHPGPGRVDTTPQNLTPASGRQDHTTSPSATVCAKGLAGPRAARPVPATTGSNIVRPHAGRSLTGTPALQSHCAPDAVASTASHRAFVTTRAQPLFGGDGRIAKGDLPDGLSEIFLREGLDRFFADFPVG